MIDNYVVFHGTITYIYKTQKGEHLLLRIRDNKNNNVSFFICDPELKKRFYADDGYAVGDRVTAIGNLQSKRSMDGKKYLTTVFVDNIVRPEPLYPCCNRFFLHGRIMKIYNTSECKTITIRTQTNGRLSDVDVVYYHADEYLKRLKCGDKISTSGRLQTVRKQQPDGTTRFYQNNVGYSSSCRRIR